MADDRPQEQTENSPPPVPEAQRLTYAPQVKRTSFFSLSCRTDEIAISLVIFSLLFTGLMEALGLSMAIIAVIVGIISLFCKRSRKVLSIIAIIVGSLISTVLTYAIVNSDGRSRELARQAVCQSNLNTIGKGIILYQSDNADTSPPNLNVLVAGGMVPAKTLICPATDQHQPRGYFYLARPAETKPNGLVACDWAGNHPDGRRCVLYSYGNVSALRPAEFAAELAKSENAAFAQALQRAEQP